MILETKCLILRPWEDADAEILYKWASDPDVGPRAGWPPHTSVENSLEIIHGPLGEPETYALVLKETGEPIGSAGLFPPEEFCSPADLPEGVVQLELGYWIAKPYWGRGLVPEAGRELLRHAFEDLGCVMAHCCHFDFNAQSKRVIEKLGFTYHTTREVVCSQLGETRTDVCYILPRGEWEKIR
ncbi:MAG: GNAT family N-acetyltransferase [Oscillospiraceae bacterium]|nr:GNAT family N-acetyltransferase [Oscillospiraceae bacterium]MBP3519971.1 GNAT family N-acetyltransferase [Oscillospiraceae bacterium]